MRTVFLSTVAAVALLATPALAQSSTDQGGTSAAPQVDCPMGQQRIAGACAVITGPAAGGGAADAMTSGTTGAMGTTTGTGGTGGDSQPTTGSSNQ